ncbi:MAG: carboxypeptidase M32, partial [Longicatena sp.]
MKKNQTSLFKEYKEKSNAYNLALNTLYFDIATIAPKDGLSYRNRMLSILSGEAFSHDTSSENVALIEEMARNKENSKELQKELDLLLRDLSDIRVLPKEVYISFTQLKADSQNAWEKAKEANDYQIFKPYLIQIIEKQKEILTYVNKTCSDYDYLLDRYQEGLDIKTYDKFFNKIKEELLPFIKRIQSEGKRINQQILLQPYPVEKQRAFMDILIKHLEADQKKCYITTSEHPFTEFFSTNETRITTHYHENNVMSAIFSTIHEYGHANYGLHVNPDFEGTTLQKAIGFAMHESQSRFLENHIGRNPHFWMPLYPKLQAHFPEHLNDVSFDAFMEMINVSEPSFIRTEADELTYPIHILIRYELEKAIFDGEVDYEQLDTMWNDK